MSDMLALVRFKKTGNIYYGCYNEATNMLLPYVCSAEECGGKNPMNYCKALTHLNTDINLDDIPMLDEIEIYCNGYYWLGKGNETLRAIKRNLSSRQEYQPQWAKDFLVLDRKKELSKQLNLMIMYFFKWRLLDGKEKEAIKKDLNGTIDALGSLLKIKTVDGIGGIHMFDLDK